MHPEVINERYLDDEEQYWDYGTEQITNPNDIIDTTKSGHGSDIDIFLTKSGADKMEKEENRKGEIVMMSPDEYYSECSNYAWVNSSNTPERLKRGRRADKETLEKLKNVLTQYKRKFCIPYIDYASPGQEGLHRMMVIGDLYGWDFKVPVLTIRVADEEEEARRELKRKQWNIKMMVDDACTKAFYYNYKDIDEFREQLQWELDRKFEYSDYLTPPIDFEVSIDGEIIKVIVDGVESEFWIDCLNIQPKNELDDVDWEDLDITEDDLDDIDILLNKL